MRRYIFYLLLVITLSVTATYAQNEADPSEIYNKAETAFEKGDLPQAITLYKKVIELLPDSFEPKYQCANAYLAIGKAESISEAVELLKEVTKLKPDFARGYATLGNALSRLNENEAAEAALRQALKLDEKLPIRNLLAEILISRKAYKEAETELKALISQSKAEVRTYLLLAFAQEEQNQLEAAIITYNRANELQPNDVDILYRRGQVYLKQKNFATAITDLKKAYELSQNNVAIGLALVESYKQSGDNKSAIALTQTLAEKASPETQAILTEQLAQLGANADAIGKLEKLLESAPKNIQYLTQLGQLYLSINPIKSVTYWQQAVEINPSPDNQVGLASALLKSQKYNDSIQYFKTVLSQNPNNYEAHAGMALALFKLGQFAPSAEQFIWVIKARPNNSINYYFLGICFDKLMDYRQALSAYELFIKTADPKLRKGEIEEVNIRLPILRRQIEKQPKKK
jgi:tetratricopeptide (TPR) repeat protein